MTYVASNNGITYLATAVTTTPASGTVETWNVGSTAGRFPQITAGQQFPISIGPPTDLDPEICLVTGLVDGTHWQLQRGAEGSTIKTHAVNDPIMATVTQASLAALITEEGPQPATSVTGPDAFGAVSSTGTSTRYARQDHDHGLPANPAPGFVTPAIALGTAAVGGAAASVIRSDATIAAFDTTSPTSSAVGDAAATGTAAVAARRDHTHGRESFSGTAPAQTGTAAGAVGSSTSPARSDHSHQVTAAIALVQENVNVVAASGAAQTIPDVTTATANEITLNANCTLTFPTGAVGKSFALDLTQDATGSRLVTWPTTAVLVWAGGTAPTLTTTAGKTDSFVFKWNSQRSLWFGYVSAENF